MGWTTGALGVASDPTGLTASDPGTIRGGPLLESQDVAVHAGSY